MAKKKKPAKSSKRSPAGKSGASIRLTDVWPQERDYMTRPDRYKYVRKLLPAQGCVFCQALDKGVGLESLVLSKGRDAMVMLNKYPYNSGHLLILPTRHCSHLLELTDEEYFEVQRQLRQAVKAVLSCYECSGFNVGLNHGAVAGAGIPDHLHWHVVPRWLGDTNFFPLLAETKVLVETLEQTYARLKSFFE
jgi:ATP adenylyltransferase